MLFKQTWNVLNAYSRYLKFKKGNCVYVTMFSAGYVLW